MTLARFDKVLDTIFVLRQEELLVTQLIDLLVKMSELPQLEDHIISLVLHLYILNLHVNLLLVELLFILICLGLLLR